MAHAISSHRNSATLVIGWLASALLISATLFAGRPVNDDYWALGSLMTQGFWGSLAWYYMGFQGNVSSWLFILMHELPWIGGVTPLASAVSIGLTFAILAGACWGALTFLGLQWAKGWRFWASLSIVTVVAWLSLASLVSPNAMTLVFYMPSTIVHVWPWCLALLALGASVRGRNLRLGWLLMGLLGFLAGNLGMVEAVVIACATVLAGIFARRKADALPIDQRLALGWVVGLGMGLAVQVASPATWGRGGGLGTDGALATNVDAVNRIFNQADAFAGPALSRSLLSLLDIEVWARLLVPVAVAGDLLLRPGLLAAFVLAAWWAARQPREFMLTHYALCGRLLLLTLVAAIGALAYSASGALYAFAGRHVAGLALLVTTLFAGLGVLGSTWWARHQRLIVLGALTSLIVVAGLALQQVRYGWIRAEAWDEALAVNKALIVKERIADLIDVPLKAGISQSGLRDHDRSRAFIEWVRAQSLP